MSAAVERAFSGSSSPGHGRPPAARGRAPFRPTGPSVVVLVAGLLLAAVLSWACYVVNSRNETRLLGLQTKQTGTVLQVVLPTIQTPLASAAAIAAIGDGDPAAFRSYMSGYVGGRKTFVSASLWSVSSGAPRLLASVGAAPLLRADSHRLATFFAGAMKTTQLSVIGPLSGRGYRLGYAFTPDREATGYVVYAESALPAGRRAVISAGSPFSNLRFALYLGDSADPASLLETNASHLPLEGRTARVTIPFGAAELSLVASSRTQLGGSLSLRLWWIVAVAGGLLALVAAFLCDRLIRRRRRAEALTEQVQQLHRQQRSIAQTLQRSLLPQRLPELSGVEVGVRYVPGTDDLQIGGDWYDVISLDDGRFFFVIGDVSGRGLQAGTVMASLHYAIRAFVSERHPPAEVLKLLSTMLDIRRDGHFATVLCGVADIGRRELTIANAGHLPVLLISEGQARFVSGEVGPPIGATASSTYLPETVTVPRGATVLVYTDGLIERRNESIDDGFARLQQAAAAPVAAVEELLTRLVEQLATDQHRDDTAILGMRWLD